MPVWIDAGHPQHSVTAFFGYGRKMAGRVGTANETGAAVQRVPAAHLGRAVVRRRPRDREDRQRYLLATTQEHHLMEDRSPVRVATLDGIHQGPGGHRAPGPRVPEDADAVSRARLRRLQVGHGDRPDVLHRLRRLHHRLRGGEQHPGRRQGAGLQGTRDALDPRRPLLRRATSTIPSRTTSRCRACSARTRPAKWSARSPRRRTARKA